MAKSTQNVSVSIEKFKIGVPAISKQSVQAMAEKVYVDIMEGKTTASSVAELFKFTSELEENIKKLSDDNGNNKFVDLIRDEISKNSDDGLTIQSKNGTKFSLFEAGTKYSYESTNDPIWKSLNAQMMTLKQLISDREKFLKTIKGSLIISLPDPETGELIENIEIFEPTKTSTSTFKAELLKD